MAKKMLINAMHPEEARVAIVDDGRLMELDVEIAGYEATRSNVYKGVVVRVEPGLQAAFVDIGLKKLGFLQVGEIHPDFYQWRDDIPQEQRSRRPRIQEILRRGQELIVQVEKGERDNKGAALTTYLSLPGRYMVLMPGSDSSGVSRKVENDEERKKLKEIVAELEIPEGIGYIVRTEAVGRKKTELAKDLEYLLNLYATIREKAAAASGPTLIYQESSLVIRSIRDYFTADIDEVLVDDKEVYRQARSFFQELMPKYEKIVKLHGEKRPIFSKYQLEEQIDLIYEKKVPLKSGGSIVIDPTEALVSIDVNSGKTTGERGVEDTAFKTNMEAAEEAARQLRLRDLGGLIVIDFIDMRDRKHISEVEKTLKHALKADKARVTVGKISQFGLLEMSRQRIKQNLNEGSVLICPHCSGQGKVKSVETMALACLRKIHAAACKGTVAEVHCGLPLEVTYYLLNRKKTELARIEKEYDIQVTVKGKTSFLLNQMELELVKRDKQPGAEGQRDDSSEVPEETAGEAEGTAAAAAVAEGEKSGKRKRRRKKSKTAGTSASEASEQSAAEDEAPPSAEESAAPAADLEPAGDEAMDESSDVADSEQADAGEEPKKKRRRRRRRGKKPASAADDGMPVEVEAGQEEAGQEMTIADEADNEPVADADSGTEAAAAEAELPPAADEPPPARKRTRRPSGKKQTPPDQPTDAADAEAAVPAVPVSEPAQVVTEPAVSAKPRRGRKPKAAAEPAVADSSEIAPPAPVRAKRAPRAKKAAPPADATASSGDGSPEGSDQHT